jgi:hypothetical protein
LAESQKFGSKIIYLLQILESHMVLFKLGANKITATVYFLITFISHREQKRQYNFTLPYNSLPQFNVSFFLSDLLIEQIFLS